MKKTIAAVFLMLVVIASISYFVPNDKEYIPKELGMDGNIEINAQIPSVGNAIPHYKIVGENNYHENNDTIITPRKSLPTEKDAIKIANEYLQNNNHLPNNAYLSNVETLYIKTINTSTGEGVVEKEDPVLVQVSYGRSIGKYPVVGPGDEITVSIGENNEVIYVSKNWKELEQVGEISIIDANAAISKLKEGKIVQNTAGPDCPIVEINEIEVGYFSDLSDSGQEFYEPVWIFKGTDKQGDNATKYVSGVSK